MATFIQNCLCKGARPSYIAHAPSFLRNGLLSRMMQDRSRVRYLLAPEGFGKTLLAVSYAQLVNSFDGTVWMDARNPCFLRDLDAGVLESGLLEMAQPGSVAVFDDVPALDQVRAARFWMVCQRLLERGSEVVVCATPCADPLAAYARSCLAFAPRDLLYSNEDLAALSSSLSAIVHLDPPRGVVDRIPSLAQRVPGSYERFLLAHVADLGDARQRTLSYLALVLGQGTSEDLGEAMGTEVFLEDLRTETVRPFIVVDEHLDEFDASGMPLSEALRAFGSATGAIAKEVGASSASRMNVQLANMLVSRGLEGRAAVLVASGTVPSDRADWLGDNQGLLLARLELTAAEGLFDTLRRSRRTVSEHLTCASIVRRALLGSSVASGDEILRALSSEKAPLRWRIIAASVLLLSGRPPGPGPQAGEPAAEAPSPSDADWALDLARALAGPSLAQLAHSDGPTDGEGALAALWESMGVPDAQPNDILAAAERHVARATSLLPGARLAPFGPTARQPFHPVNVASLLCACILKACEAEALPPSAKPRALALAASCVQLASRLHAEGPFELLLLDQITANEDRLGMSAVRRNCSMLRYDTLRSSLEVQRAAFRRTHPAESSSAKGPAALHTAHTPVYAAALPGVPLLRIGVFGRFDVRLGDEAIDSPHFRRSKVRILLTLLALEDGRFLSCERLSSRLWPGSDPDNARHNLYSTISFLRKSLSLPGGNCPYIHREVGVVGLNPEVVTSDVADLELLCHKLRFDEVDPEAFLRILDQLRSAYRGDLLPGELDESLIVAARSAWLDKIVESLMVGARRLAMQSHGQVALQLAQHALEVDPRREDCYELLMSLQADCGQRPAAIDTWFTYCRYVDRELGLDPSPRVMDLYNRIIS